MVIISYMDFSDWITRKYIEWRGDAIGNERSIREYSDMLGISRSVMSRWLDGKSQPRDKDNITRLVDYYGDEVYDVLGLPRPTVIEPYTPRSLRLLIDLAQREAERRIRLAGLTGSDAESEEIMTEIFHEFGITWADIKYPGKDG